MIKALLATVKMAEAMHQSDSDNNDEFLAIFDSDTDSDFEFEGFTDEDCDLEEQVAQISLSEQDSDED